MAQDPQSVDIAVIGAGFAGLCAAIRLDQEGRRDYVVLEADDELGGTWRDNTYPGAACDVPSVLYSLSFAPWPEWSRRFAVQAEILAYMNYCADHFGVRDRIRFGTRVLSAAWDEDAALWRLEVSRGAPVHARVLMSGTGPLNQVKMPDIPGLDDFEGPLFHSGAWDDAVDLRDKRVAVIGTGASAIQVVPAIAPVVAHLDLYQRTPPWIVPRPDRQKGRLEKSLYRRLPLVQKARRAALYGYLEVRGLGYVHPSLMGRLEREAQAHLDAQVPDPELRAKVQPHFQVGCKRLLVSSDYYPALLQPHVDVVTGGATAITRTGVVGGDGVERPADVIALCTGFDAYRALTPFPVTGKGGVQLGELWAEHAEAYYGSAVSGFPNLFFIVGPNVGLGHSSMVFMIEVQVEYALRCLDVLDRKGRRWMAPHLSAQDRFNAWVRERLQDTVWAAGCHSWYLDDEGRNSTVWPGLTLDFWWKLRRPRRRDFVYG